MKTGYNNLTVKIYSSGITEVTDVDGSISRASIESFETSYPGGIFGPATIKCARDVTRSWLVKEHQRIQILNGLTVVYEGEILSIATDIEAGAQSNTLNCVGYYGSLFGMQTWNKRWADNRVSEDIWIVNATQMNGTAFAMDMAQADRENRIHIAPNAVAWDTNYLYKINYTMPTGETIKRVTCNHDFNESTQAWELQLRDMTLTGPVNIWDVTATGTAAHDDTLGTPRQSLAFRLVSNAAQTPPNGTTGCVYGEISSVVVYSELGDINLTEITKDCATKVSSVSTDYTYVGSNTFSLIPFFTDGRETIASILERAVAYGDSSYNAWAVGLRESDTGGAPMAYCEQQPALTDYDYAVRLEECEAPFSLIRDLSEVYNWIYVSYRDDKNDRDITLTPDDDATLKDQTSIDDNGRRDYPLDAGSATTTTAKNIAKRFLAQHKDMHYYVSGPINKRGSIRGKSGQPIPVSQIRAGKRVKVENFLQDLSGTGLTFLISQTSYSDADEACSISCGLPGDNAAVTLAQLELKAMRK